MNEYTLYHADCLDVFGQLAPGSVDAVICDPPYGTTACKWDSVIPFEPMWHGIKRVLRPRGACVLFGSEPYSSYLRVSNIGWYKFDCVWKKSRSRIANYAMVKDMPGKIHENIIVFSAAALAHNSAVKMTYNPQGATRIDKLIVYDYGGSKGGQHLPNRKPQKIPGVQSFTNYPTTIIDIPSETRFLHPTQKPLALLEYLVRTYTNAGDLVLDFAMGSGTTGHACANTQRRFVGIERDKAYFDIASERIATAYAPLRHMEQAHARV